MLRYGICPIIGSGTQQSPYRASVQDVEGVNSSAIIPTDQQGAPVYGFAPVVVSAANWSPVLAISNSYWFPVHGFDSQMSSMESDARTGMEQSVEAFDMDGNGLHLDASHDGTDSYRHVLEAIFQQVEPAMSLDTFSVAEVSE